MFRRPRFPILAFRPAVLLVFWFFSASLLHAGLSFDAGASPEEARDLLAGDSTPPAPADSWLRLRDMDRSAVRNRAGAEIPPRAGASPAHSIDARRQALEQLRAKGFHLIGFLRWPSDSWVGGVRTDNPIRRLAYDLREPFERCCALAATYGDLIDYWEIENEPDISFVEENPETYAAFLKACYLGIAAGRSDDLKVRVPEDRRSRRSDLQPSRPSVARSAILMAPLALPPGPYLSAFIANRGLQYTDGFNYHYYGYAEDFSGVYEQFHDAVTAERPGTAGPTPGRSETPPTRPSDHPASDTDTVFATNFYPNTAGWNVTEVAGFNHTAENAQANRALLEARPLAEGEPKLVSQGRWLVSSGVTVEETAEGWRFHVTKLPTEPMRPAMAELPLPNGWTADANALLSFEHRIVSSGDTPAIGDTAQEMPEKPWAKGTASGAIASSPRLTSESPAPETNSQLPTTNSTASLRSLPIFLTEYGYGLLDKSARNTVEGRARQEAWFSRAIPQIHSLGITGAMAFLLTPYLEADRNEFGLLMKAEGRMTGGPDGQTIGTPDLPAFGSSGLLVSPALNTLIADSRKPITQQTWTVAGAVAPSSVVLDFVAGTGLAQAKSYAGYLLRGDYGRNVLAAEGRLIVYNLGSAAVTGELRLDGDTWILPDGSRTTTLSLPAGERREVQVRILPTTHRFEPQAVQATFHVSETSSTGLRPPASGVQGATPAALGKPKSEILPTMTAAPLHAEFDTYVRTANGNLYQTWPRSTATETWGRYSQRLGNFTMAFFGRAALSPAPFAPGAFDSAPRPSGPPSIPSSPPAALVLFFRPEQLPLTFEIRSARVIELSAP